MESINKKRKGERAAPDLSPPTWPQWRTVLLVGLALFALKMGLSLQSTGPWFEPDETTYAVYGYHFAQGDGLSWRHPGRGMGMPGYSLFLSLPWLASGDNAEVFYVLALLSNCLMAMGGVVVGYAILRHWFPHRASLLAAVGMMLYASAFVRGFALLSENLFILLCLIDVWLTQKACTSSRWYYWPLLGLMVGLTLLTRMTGWSMVLALGVVAGYQWLRQPRWKTFISGSLGILAMVVVIWAIYIYPQPKLPAQYEMPHPPGANAVVETISTAGAYKINPSELQYLLRPFRENPWRFLDFGQALLFALAYICLAGMAVMPIMFFIFIIQRWRLSGACGWRAVDPIILFIVLVAVFAPVLYALKVGLTFGLSNNIESRLIGRYFDQVVILAIGFGLAQIMSNDIFRRRSVMILTLSIVALLIAVGTLYHESAMFTENLGVSYFFTRVSDLPKEIAPYFGQPEDLRILCGLVILLGLVLSWMLCRRPLAATVPLLFLLAASTAMTYQESLKFRSQFTFFQKFGKNARPVLHDFFAARPGQPRVIYTDKLPDSDRMPRGITAGTANLIRMFSVSALEFWNPGTTAVEVSNQRYYPGDALMFSLCQPNLPELFRDEYVFPIGLYYNRQPGFYVGTRARTGGRLYQPGDAVEGTSESQLTPAENSR